MVPKAFGAVVVILAKTYRLPDIQPFVPNILKALNTLQPRSLVEVGLP